jgi:hypothetical protein
MPEWCCSTCPACGGQDLQILVALPDPRLCRCRRCGAQCACSSSEREASHLAEVRASHSVQAFVHSGFDSLDLLALLRRADGAVERSHIAQHRAIIASMHLHAALHQSDNLGRHAE